MNHFKLIYYPLNKEHPPKIILSSHWPSEGHVGPISYQHATETSHRNLYPSYHHHPPKMHYKNNDPHPLGFSGSFGPLEMLSGFSDSTYPTDSRLMILRNTSICKIYSKVQLPQVTHPISLRSSGSATTFILTRTNLLFVLEIGTGTTAFRNLVRASVNFLILLETLGFTQMMCETRSGAR